MRWTAVFHLLKLFAWVVFAFGACLLLARAANLSTSVVTTPAVTTLTQKDYRWYQNIDALTPSSSLAVEDATASTPAVGSVVRLRMNIEDANVQLNSGATFSLQYANATSGPWTAVSTSTAWIFFDNPSIADGQIIVTTVLGTSDTGESYGESNPSAAAPNPLLPGQHGEWDWVLQNNSASTATNWFFRMIYSSSTLLNFYINFPALSAVPPPPPPPPSPSPSTPPSVIIGVGGGYPLPSPTSSAAQPPISTSTPSAEQTSTLEEATTSLPIPPPILPPMFQAIDLNGDNRIDIVDLSILIYYEGKNGPDASRYDLNKDGTVDLVDISILMYYWVE